MPPLIEVEVVEVLVRVRLPLPLVDELDALTAQLGASGRAEVLRLVVETGVRELNRRSTSRRRHHKGDVVGSANSRNMLKR